ncbi:M23 family metallopeptidase [Natribacillus halophilus]|uniref:Stage II sporulation protein Q n=1 Tax=Natribacillus halophilus TaxID=549003 RepID=A0A1G8KV43_9BACI|nr:M23 family metallopeptidase [Natribacillus halophilus]SDI46760.1 stage II sporulation protein Q [Natribacillus halophilus]
MKDEEKKASESREKENPGGQIKQWSKKPWFWPAVYLTVCGVLLSSFFAFQSGETDIAEESEQDEGFGVDVDPEDEEALPVGAEAEEMQLPVQDEDVVDVVGYFYDHDASAEEQEAALVYYNQIYYQNKGIDLAHPEGESFEAAAALSGEVVKAEQDSLLGNVVEINHEDELVTAYHSLEDLEVEEGDVVAKGDVIGTAGENTYNRDAGVHVHFEVRQDGVAFNPEDMLHQTVSEMTFDEEEGLDAETDPSEGERDEDGAEEAPAEEDPSDEPEEDEGDEDEEENTDNDED